MAKNINDAYQRSIRIQEIIRLIVCIIITIISLLPIYIIVINATRSSADITAHGVTLIPSGKLFENFRILTSPDTLDGAIVRIFNLGKGYLNSFIIAASSTILSVFFSGMTAYGLVVYDFKLKNAATTFILAIMMIPTQVISVGFLNFMASIKLGT